MKRIVWIILCAIICNYAYSQNSNCSYKVLENGFFGDFEVAGKEYLSGQIIYLKEVSTFDLQRIKNGIITKENVYKKSGAFNVDSLFRLAQNEKIALKNYKAPNVSKASSQHKSAEYTLFGFTSKLAGFIGGQQKYQFEYGAVEVKRSSQTVYVTNISDNDMYVDIVWLLDNQCMSAISFLRDFVNNKVLYPGETMKCVVDGYVADEDLYVVCTPNPIEYNTIDTSQASEQDLSSDLTIPLTIVKLDK